MDELRKAPGDAIRTLGLLCHSFAIRNSSFVDFRSRIGEPEKQIARRIGDGQIIRAIRQRGRAAGRPTGNGGGQIAVLMQRPASDVCQ